MSCHDLRYPQELGIISQLMNSVSPAAKPMGSTEEARYDSMDWPVASFEPKM